MGLHVVTVAVGRPAAEALRDAVAGGKHDDALAPVSVVVPTNYVGVAARRALGSGALGAVTGQGVGIAGVTFLTVYRVAELLGAPRLAAAGRRPVSTPVLGAAIRGVLAREAGMFTAVAEHPATEQALVDAYRELSQCDTDALDALVRAGRRAHEVVRVCRAARATLESDWYDERDLMDAAIASVADASPVLRDLGALVVHLPQDLSAPAARLLLAVAEHAEVTVVAGVTGVARADAGVAAAVARLGVALDADAAACVAAPHATEVVSASDPDDEVRAAVRLVMAALVDGVPLERMAILYGAAEPYARLVHEQLDAAGLAHNGASVRTLAESVLGRSLLGLLRLPERDFHRHDVMALLASAPVWYDGRPVPSARWERISRRAGIVRGAEQWRQRLGRHATALAEQLAEELAVPDRDPRPDWYEHELAATRELDRFVAALRDALRDGARAGAGWGDLSTWARGLVRTYLARDTRRATWPEPEQQAADKVEAALERLAGLDAVEPAPGVDVFLRTLELELDADLGRVGRLGEGLLMGHVALGLGLDLDRVFVCGMAEGTFPARVRDDSLLPDVDRRATAGALALRSARVDVDHRMLLCALAACDGPRVLLYPRGDLRRTTDRMPSRFLLDTVESLVGERHYVEGFETLDVPWLRAVPSFAAGLARTSFPATDQEHRLRTLLDHTRTGEQVGNAGLRAHDVALDRGLDCALSRASRAFTRFDGNLGASALELPSPAAPEAVVSATRLERWAICPFDYLMEHLLRVEIPELPEEVYELSPLDRGALVHETLDEFLREVLARDGGPPTPDQSWTPADRDRLHAIAEAQCARYEALGVTGRRAFWDRDRRRILADLDRFLAEDSVMRAAERRTTLASELSFGLPGAAWPAIEVGLSDGRTLRFRGAADRVDGSPGGGLFVIDYKTGFPYAVGEGGDPTEGGTKLQLPVYALAARAAFGGPDTHVVAAYWYISTRGDFRWAWVALDEHTRARVDEVLRTIVDGIEQGVFAARLDPPDSWTRRRRTFVDPDARGTRDRYREWARKQDAPELAGYRALSEPPEDEDEAEAGDALEPAR
ncbi:MAG TPA: PD-(D/E)XK nuclease family protein [Acidimicrobiia bacterium]